MLNPIELRDVKGLSEQEVVRRLQRDGYNELPASKQRSIFRIALDVIREPMFLLLVACGALYLLLGDIQEALMLLCFVGIVMGITLFQERKTERALEALRDISSPRALVIRDGQEKRIAGRDIVRGDIVVVSEGDRVPADGSVLSCVNLLADESLLTGESLPVRKTSGLQTKALERPGGDDLSSVFSGTLIVQGQGLVEVLAIGAQTELGKIGKALQQVESEETLLQRETNRLVRNLSGVGLSLCAIVIITYGLTRGDWLEGILAGITLAMATLPEELPVVLTVFLSLGAWRMSVKNVLTRRVPAIETLGAATVLCVDKTGTLTQNRMAVKKICTENAVFDVQDEREPSLPEEFHELMEYSILASQIDPFDPMEKAIKQLGNRYLAHTEHLHHDWALVHEYPLSKKLLSLSRVWLSPDGIDYIIAAKGAPEAIADLCHLSESKLAELSEKISSLAHKGLRVLGVAKAHFKKTVLPIEQHDFEFRFLGLIGLADPIRQTVPEAIRECYSAGIRVVMITGDYPGTAMNIADQIGLRNASQVVTGLELEQLSDSELFERVRSVNIFARVVPEQKLLLVNAMKANGEIVAMTGDGVNDAPALKTAHIGIAMGMRGTDVAREAASLVLLDDDFLSIKQAVRMGRRIYDNIKKAVAYIFAIHVPIAGMALLPVLFKDFFQTLGWSANALVFLPMHIMFLELIIDPACSVVFEAEAEEADVMTRPPRPPHSPIFSHRTVILSILQGVSVLVILLLVFTFALYLGHDENEVRALTFTTLIIANLGLILTNRSWSKTIMASIRTPNPALWWVIGGAMVFLGLVLYVPFLRTLFRFNFLHLIDLTICCVAGIVSILWFEGLKLLRRFQRTVSPTQ